MLKFSKDEIEQLIKAGIVLSLAFTILNIGLRDLIFGFNNIYKFFNIFIIFIITLLTVGLAFLVHELAHKFLAQKYKCKAEFKANNTMLFFGLMTSFLGFIFISPGAVYIQGRINKSQNAKISLVGPLSNLILGFIFFVFFVFFRDTIISNFFFYGLKINFFLGFFNLLPFYGFDGFNVFKWNKFIYFFFLIIALILWFLSFFII
ncbi:MAG: hypothetical protein QXE31_01445 [Candidatus Woesearchaeota archaeon]